MNWLRKTFTGWRNMLNNQYSEHHKSRLERQRTRDLQARMRSGILFYPVVWAVVGCGMLIKSPSIPLLVIVLVIFVLELSITLIRFRLLNLSKRMAHRRRSAYINDVGVALSAVTWASVLVATLLDTPLQEHFALIVVATIAISSGALVNLSIRRQTVRNFLLAMFSPAIIVACTDQESGNQGLSLILTLYVIAMYMLSRLPRAEYERAVLGNLRLQQQTRQLIELSNNDALTGLRNRRYFESTLKQECSRASRLEYPISLLIVDIDYFKSINDRFGHMVGDHCLRQVADLIGKGFLRAQDTVARIGGEEFAVILPGMTQHDASALAHALRETINSKTFQTENTDPYRVSISIGGTCALLPGDKDPSRILKLADDALYESKAYGRNRLTWRNA